MIVILSPAKKLNEAPVDFDYPFSQPQFIPEAGTLIQKLKKISSKKLMQLMNISPVLADTNKVRYEQWSELHQFQNAKPAVFLFNGEAYLGLKASSLSIGDLDYAQDHLRILSGLYGLLKPMDLIHPYRLEMGTNISIQRKKNLYAFWKEKITTALNNDLEKQSSKYLVNVASNEYFSAIDTKKLKADIINCKFLENKNGSYKPVMVFAKRARGMMARFIIQNKIEKPEDLHAFDLDGYTINNQLTKDNNNLIFTRG
ncbi:MAG: peroxide stress protein YaaA [Vicingaceae bacterium]